MKLELRVNGATVVRDVPAEELLLDFLRERLFLGNDTCFNQTHKCLLKCLRSRRDTFFHCLFNLAYFSFFH